MSKLLYFLATFAESGLSVFGLRGTYEQPAYRVVQTLAPDIEIRAYAPRLAVETPIGEGGQGAAFGRLFRYITGANTAARTVPMTAPVEQSSQLIPMTVPVEFSGGQARMRFFLPASLASSGAPVPTEPDVHLVSLPAMTLGVVRYSGTASQDARDRQTARLRRALAAAGRVPQGAPIAFSYDPPFTIPFLRRNEMALELPGA
jgi:hypothetical protein